MRLTGLFCVASALWGANASPDQIRNAATKGLAAIQASQKDWYKKQSCTSCHQQYLPLMAVVAAREHGIAFDETIAKEETERAFALYTDLDRAVQYYNVIDPALDD